MHAKLAIFLLYIVHFSKSKLVRNEYNLVILTRLIHLFLYVCDCSHKKKDMTNQKEIEPWSVRNNLIVCEFTQESKITLEEVTSPAALTILIITQGSIQITFDQKVQTIESNSVIRTIPEHLMHFDTASPNFQGKIISINRDLLNFSTTSFSPNSFLYIRQQPILRLTDTEMADVLEIFSLIKLKSNKESSEKVIYCLIMTLYFELAECLDKKINERPQLILSHKENLYKKFLNLLQANIRKEHSVSFYANQLCLTPQYISSVLKELSGMTANRWIDEMLLGEAKLLLFSTENNIQQIADKLHFPDQSSFGKFFKKMTGLSPNNYKKLRAKQ